jgi:hypothetical protein
MIKYFLKFNLTFGILFSLLLTIELFEKNQFNREEYKALWSSILVSLLLILFDIIYFKYKKNNINK